MNAHHNKITARMAGVETRMDTRPFVGSEPTTGRSDNV